MYYYWLFYHYFPAFKLQDDARSSDLLTSAPVCVETYFIFIFCYYSSFKIKLTDTFNQVTVCLTELTAGEQ